MLTRLRELLRSKGKTSIFSAVLAIILVLAVSAIGFAEEGAPQFKTMLPEASILGNAIPQNSVDEIAQKQSTQITNHIPPANADKATVAGEITTMAIFLYKLQASYESCTKYISEQGRHAHLINARILNKSYGITSEILENKMRKQATCVGLAKVSLHSVPLRRI